MRKSPACNVPKAAPDLAAHFAVRLSSLLLPSLPIAVAVSGGPDSMALCLLANDFARRHGLSLTALTVDHGLRAESTEETRYVGEWMKAQYITYHILTWKGTTGANLQARAREARYRLMAEWCRKNKVPQLLLGHTADDQAETFLLNLTRGSGVYGLAGMPERRGENGILLIRPLLEVTKETLKHYLRGMGQAWIEDPSNAEERFTRVRLRKLRALLKKEGLSDARLLDTVRNMQRTRETIAHYANSLLDACLTKKEEHLLFSLTPYRQAPEEIRLRTLGEIIRHVGENAQPPRLEELLRFDHFLLAHEGSGRTLGHTRWQRSRKQGENELWRITKEHPSD